MTERHTDGNSIAGLLGQVLAVDPTRVMRSCHSCGDRRPVADHRAYRGAGIVLRCPSCGDVALRAGLGGDRLTVELRGTFRMVVEDGSAV